MSVKLGYGGVANTNGARDFSGKAAAGAEVAPASTARLYRAGRALLMFVFALVRS